MAEMLTYAPDLRVDHRRAGRLHDGVRALRGGPGAPRRRRSSTRPSARSEAVSVKRVGERPGSRAAASYARRHDTTDIHDAPPRRSPATSAGARCCAASTPRSTWPAAARRTVCELCTPRALARGLDPRGPSTTSRDAQPASTARRARCSAACADAGGAAADEEPRDAARRRARGTARGRRRRPRRRRAGRRRRARRRREPRHVRAVPTSAELKIARALDAVQRAPSTRARSPASPARSARRASACAPRDGAASVVDDRRRRGSCAGTATRSTCPTRRPASRLAGQGNELDELAAERAPSANAAADERGTLAPASAARRRVRAAAVR